MEIFITIVLICSVLALLYRYTIHKDRHKHSRIPTLKGYPFIGSLFELDPQNLHEQLSEFARKHGDIFQFQLFGATNVVLNSAEVVNKAFCQEHFKDVFNDRPGLYVGNHINGRNNITLRNRDKVHSSLRKCFSKAMHIYGDGIPAFENVMKTEIHRVIEYIENCKGGEFEVIALSERSLSNVMSILIIGEPATEEDVKCYFEFTQATDFFLNPLFNLILTKLPFLRFSPFFKPQYEKIMNAHRKIMDRMFYKMKETHVSGIYRGVIDWYFEEQQKEKQNGEVQLLTDAVIMAMIIDILVAGLITTSAALPSAILCLINHPEYQNKIQEELENVTGKDREPSISDRCECHFLQAFVMETLRLLPPSPIFLPHVCSEDTVFEGHLIRKQTQIMTNIWHIHHDEKTWEDPWVFRPERFLDQDSKILPTSHIRMKNWLAFGTGQRKCPGMCLATTRIFLYLAFLIQKFTFLPSPGKHVSHDPRKGDFEYNLLLRPKPFYCVVDKKTG